jgi:hypothetical protein
VSNTGSAVKPRTVSSGGATETVYNLGGTVTRIRFYVIVVTATEVKFYLDGELIATHNTNIPPASPNVYLGTSYSGSDGVSLEGDYVSFESIR